MIERLLIETSHGEAFSLDVRRDPEAGVWIAVSPPGSGLALVLESETLDGLLAELEQLVPDLREADP